MNTASATETATSATWAAQTPASATAQSWAAAAATTTAYDQYYNYYQSVPPPAATAASAPLATTTASMATPAASYQQDYTQAWDDYYKAYYGQTYSTTAATAATTAAAAQYPASYSYDQYGYANLSAPPPNYYDSSAPAPAASYDYSGATSASYPGYSTSWTAEPPPAFDQSYNSAAATGASAVSAVPPYDTAQSQPPPPQSFSQPPPLSAPNYEQGAYASDPSAMTAPAAAPGYSAESFAPPAKTSKFGPKSFDYNSAPSAAAPPPSLGGNSAPAKETSYMEQFPPPSFGSPIKPGGRGGRGGAGGGPGNQRQNNQRSMNQQQMNPRNNNNNNPRFNQQFNNNNNHNNNNNNNRGGFAGNRPNNSNNDRRGFSNEFCEDNSGFPMSNNKQMMNNNSGMRRGGRGGGFNPRGGYQPPRNPDGPHWNHQAEMNECYGGGNNEFEDIDYSNEFPNSDEFDWGNQQMPPQHHPHQQQQPPPFMGPQHQPDYGHQQFLSPEDEDDDQMMFGQFGGQKPPPPLQHQQYQKPGFNNNEIPPLMSLPMGRNSNNNDGFPPGRQPPPSQMRPQQNQRPAPLLSGPSPRQGAPRFSQAGPQGPLPPARHAQPPLRLMDLTVQPSVQSPIVRRRQHALELWHTELLDIVNRRVPINRFLSVLRGALGPNMADRLSVHCFKLPPGAGVICELCLDDVFLAQARSDSVESSIEAAAKSVFELLKNNSRLCVLAATRDADGDAMPGFCVAVSPNQPVNLPPVCRPSDRIPIDSLKPLLDGGDHPMPGNSAPPSNSSNQSIPPSSVNPPVSLPANIDPSGLFLVLEAATNERDQSIASLVATARFNNIVIDYQHEKLPHAPHISSCIITIDGTEVERHEARDYLMAKRQAADKVVAKLKQTRPQITVRFDKSKVVKKTDLCQPPPSSTAPPPSSLATATSDKDAAQSTDDKDQASAPPKSFDKQALDYLKKFASSPEDVPLKFETDFSNEEKTELIKISTDLNLSHKSDGKNVLFVFKQYPLGEMKSRLVKHGFCAQYQLVAADTHCPDGAQ